MPFLLKNFLFQLKKKLIKKKLQKAFINHFGMCGSVRFFTLIVFLIFIYLYFVKNNFYNYLGNMIPKKE